MLCSRGVCVLVVALTGCGLSDLDVYPCHEPDKGHKDANGEPDPCHYNDPDGGDGGLPDDAGDAGDAEPPDAAGETCAGQCVPGLPGEWHGPALLWMGDEAAAPPCPANADLEVYTGHADPVPITCGACTCAPPIGACELPATLTTSSALCSGTPSGAVHIIFNPPSEWGGTCTTANAIPAGTLCGGVPCVQSVTIAPLTVKQSECLPIEPPNVQTQPVWKTFARACIHENFPSICSTASGLCAPTAPGPEFRTCIHHEGDPALLPCPAPYPDRSVFYQDFEDNRICSPCTCGAPSGGACTGSISIFKDSACNATTLLGTFPLDETGPKCHDLPPGVALGSKSASEPISTSGTCDAAGGAPTVKDSPHLGTVFCCLGTP